MSERSGSPPENGGSLARGGEAPTALPRPRDASGEIRRVGIEVEFSGVDEEAAAEIAARELGGTLRRDGPDDFKIETDRWGDFRIYLDSRYRSQVRDLAGERGLEVARLVVPVEFVTPPVPPEDIPKMDELLTAFAAAGGVGTSEGLLLGFGVHLNVAVTSLEVQDVLAVMKSFALLEDWIRWSDPIDLSRRALPFVAHWPRTLTDRLVDAGPDSLSALAHLYLEETQSRNHALDMLPIFATVSPTAVEMRAREAEAVSARPAYHYRLPDCRLDDPEWSLAWEWNKWALVEEVSEDHDVLRELEAKWRAHRVTWPATRAMWARLVDPVLRSAFQHLGSAP